jgi:ATP-binding cassette subfamily G (WHITE) protein 2
MCKGRSVYHGPSKEVLSYFTNQGYQCDLHENPADFVLDVLIDASQNENDLMSLRRTYKKSSMHAQVVANTSQKLTDIDLKNPLRKEKAVVIRPLGREIYHISKRTLKNAVRNPALFMSQTLVSVILGLLVGLVFNNMKKTTDPGVANRLGAIFFIVVCQIFSTVTALEPLIKERVLFIHVSSC